MPVEVMVPPVADQVTAVFVDPLTVTVNCWVWRACMVAEPGDIFNVTLGFSWFPRVQPASNRVRRERIARAQIPARDIRDARCLLVAMIFPINRVISSASDLQAKPPAGSALDSEKDGHWPIAVHVRR